VSPPNVTPYLQGREGGTEGRRDGGRVQQEHRKGGREKGREGGVTYQPLLAVAGVVRFVHAIPSGDVCTRLPVPLLATATKRLLPYVTARQLLSAALVRLVHAIPSGEVITRLPVPVIATATNKPLPHVTPNLYRGGREGGGDGRRGEGFSRSIEKEGGRKGGREGYQSLSAALV
jgi:hypothetical protein